MMTNLGFDRSIGRRVVAFFVLAAFLLSSGISPVGYAHAQEVLQLSQPGMRVDLSPAFAPPLLKGVKVYFNDPFRLDFILDKGDSHAPVDQLKSDSTRLIKYFLASLTVPEKDLWVNLSPYEKDRIVPDAFGVTEMGRDLLAQDYMLKQITASVLYPEEAIGKEFWSKVYAEAQKRFGVTDIPVDTFNKVWIVPEKAVVYENKDSAYVVESRLEVLLEEDYLALEKGAPVKGVDDEARESNKLGAEIIREVVIPILEKEVNEGKNFAQLRQVYHSLILAIWFKDKIKESIFGKAYIDQDKVAGVDVEDKAAKEKIWGQYVEAFKKGAYNYIKEEVDPVTQQIIPKKYFSGGAGMNRTRAVLSKVHDRGLLPEGVSESAMVINTQLDSLMTDQAQASGRLPETSPEEQFCKAYEGKFGKAKGDLSEPIIKGGEKYQRVYDAIAGLFGVDISDDKERLKEGKRLLDRLYEHVDKTLVSYAISHLVAYTYVASAAHRVAPIALAIKNQFLGQNIFSSEVIDDSEPAFEWLRTAHPFYAKPEVYGVSKPDDPLPELVLPRPVSKERYRVLDIGSAPKGQGSAPLNLLRRFFDEDKDLKEKKFEVVGTDVFFPVFEESAGDVRIRTDADLPEKTINQVHYYDALKYAPDAVHVADVTEKDFNLGRFDYITMVATLHHLVKTDEIFEEMPLAKVELRNPDGNPFAPKYFMAPTQQKVLTNLLNSLDEGGIFFLNLMAIQDPEKQYGISKEEADIYKVRNHEVINNNDNYILLRREGDHFVVYDQVLSFRASGKIEGAENYLLRGELEFFTKKKISDTYPGVALDDENYQKIREILRQADMQVFWYQWVNRSRWGRVMAAAKAVDRGVSFPEWLDIYMANVPPSNMKVQIIDAAKSLHQTLVGLPPLRSGQVDALRYAEVEWNARIQAESIREVRDGQGRLLAPNGEPTNLSDELWKLVRTDTFKNWFGDWENHPEEASKIVDENGEPLVMRHVSGAEFTVFKKDKINARDYKREGGKPRVPSGLGSGMYFSTSQEALDKFDDGKQSFMYEVFLNLRNPIEIDQLNFKMSKELVSTGEELGALRIKFTELRDKDLRSGQDEQDMERIHSILKEVADEVTAKAKKEGHDGSLNEAYYEEKNGKRYLRPTKDTYAVNVFEPESGAIKSIDNVGTFDASDPDILEKNAIAIKTGTRAYQFRQQDIFVQEDFVSNDKIEVVGQFITMDPGKVDVKVSVEREMVDRDLVDDPVAERKEGAGRSVGQLVSDPLTPRRDDVLMVFNGITGNFYEANSAVLVDGNFIIKGKRNDGGPAKGPTQKTDADYRPLNGTFWFLPFGSVAQGEDAIKEVQISNGELKTDLGKQTGIFGAVIVRNGESALEKDEYIHFGITPDVRGHEINAKRDKRMAMSAMGYDKDNKLFRASLNGDPNDPQKNEPTIDEFVSYLLQKGAKSAILMGTVADVKSYISEVPEGFDRYKQAVERRGEITKEQLRSIGLDADAVFERMQKEGLIEAFGDKGRFTKYFRFVKSELDKVFSALDKAKFLALAEEIKAKQNVYFNESFLGDLFYPEARPNATHVVVYKKGPDVVKKEIPNDKGVKVPAWVWTFDPTQYRPFVIVAEELEDLFRLDRKTNRIFDKTGRPVGKDELRSNVPLIEDLLGRFRKQHPDLEIVGVTGNQNLFYNAPVVTIVGHRVYHALNEDIEGRDYPMYVVWPDGTATIEEHVRFELDQDGRSAGVKIDGEDKEIVWATGIQLILDEQGFVTPGKDNNLAYFFDDLKHLFVMPVFTKDDHGVDKLMSDGIFFMADQILSDPQRIDRYFQNSEELQSFKLSATLILEDGSQKEWLIPPELLKDRLLRVGYEEQDFSIEDDRVLIRLKENGYPWHIVGITADNQVKEIAITSDKKYGDAGVTIRKVVQWLKTEKVVRAGIIDQGTTVLLKAGSVYYVDATVDGKSRDEQRASSIIVYAKTKVSEKIDRAELVNVDGFDGLFRINPLTGKLYYGDRSKAVTFSVPVYALRHAQSVAQTLPGTMHGKGADEIDQLSILGLQQAERLAPDLYALMKKRGVLDQDVIVLTSGLVRAQQTVAPFLKYASEKEGYVFPLEQTDLINEIDAGIRGYISPDQLSPEIIRVRDEVMDLNAQIKLPGGESFIDLLQRARKFILYVNEHYQGKKLIIFTHSLFMNALRIVQGIDNWEREDGVINRNQHKPENTELWAFESGVDRAQKVQEEIAESLGFKVFDQETGHITYADDFKPYDLKGIELVVVPHGLTDADVEGVLQVSKDVDDPRFELNAEGRRQVQQGARVVWDKYSEKIKAGQVVFYRSGTKRTAQTAQAFIQYMNSIVSGLVRDVIISDAIRMNLGAWEGTTKAQIDMVLSPDERARAKKFIKKNALVGPKDGQTFVEYLAVVKDYLEMLKKDNDGKTVIVFGHGIFIKALKVLLRTTDIIDTPYLDWDSGARSSYKLGMPLVVNDIPRQGDGVRNGINMWRKENTRDHSIEELAAFAANARAEGLRIWRQHKGPLAGAMSPVDLYTVLFMDYVDREKFVSRHPQRLRIVPKGTAGSTFYSTAAYAGLVEPDRVVNLDKNDLEIVPTRFGLSDVSLYKMGTSFEQAIGLALASKIKQLDFPVAVFLSDGGLQIGVDHQAKFAAQMGLNNLTVVIDVNRLQNAYRVEDVDPTLALDADGHLSRMVSLWEAYGWDVVEIDGHDFQQIRSAYDRIGQGQKPLVILAKTSKGRGMAEIEGRLNYSHKFPAEEDYHQALKALQGTVDEYRVSGYDIKYPDWVPVEKMAFDNQGFALPRSDLTTDDDPMQFERPLSDQGKMHLEKILKSWLKEFISINPNQVFIINTDNPSPFEITVPIRSSKIASPFIFAGINERFALNLAAGMFLEGLAPVYIGPAAHMPVNAEDWKMLGLGKQNVLVVARSSGSALSYWGPGHLVYEDIELFKNPWSQVLQPAHAQDLTLILENYYRTYPKERPTYLRMQEVSPFELSSTLFDTEEKRKKIFQDGLYLADSYEGRTDPVVFVVSGKTVKEAVDAGRELRQAGISYKVINIINLSSVNNESLRSLTKGAVRIVTAIDALPQSLTSLVYDALPDQRSRVLAFGVKDGGSFSSEAEIFSKNRIDSRSFIALAVKEGLIGPFVQKTLSKLPVSEESALIRDSWEQVLSETENGFINNLIKIALTAGPNVLERVVFSIIGLAEDVADPWSANYLISDLVSDYGSQLLGVVTEGLRSIVRDHEVKELGLNDAALSDAIPQVSNRMSIVELRDAVRAFRLQQRTIVLSRHDHRAVSRSIQERNIRFMRQLIPVLISRIWEDAGVDEGSPAVLYFNDIKTAASDLDVIYVGPEQERVDLQLTVLCNLLGIKRDLGTTVLINQALKEGRGGDFSGYQYGGNVEALPINGGDFDSFYRMKLDLKDPDSARKMYEDQLNNDLLTKWSDRNNFRMENLKTVYSTAVNDLIKAMVLKFRLSYGVYGDKFWERLALYLEPEDLQFLRDTYELINQARSLAQYITERRWDVADDRVAENVARLLSQQGVPDFRRTLLLAGGKIRVLMEKYLNDDEEVIADRYQGRADKNWNAIGDLYGVIIKDRLGDFVQDIISGGVDLTRSKMGLEVQSAGSGAQFKFDPDMIEQLQNASGFTPVIIDIRPMTMTVPSFLGINDDLVAVEELSVR
jgi:transketolase